MTTRPVLLLTYYFPPDFAAGAFRMQALAATLADRLPSGCQLHVLAAEPVRYRGALADPEFDDGSLGDNVTVHRLPVRWRLNVKGAQLLDFSQFAAAARRCARRLRPGLVIASTSRLGTGMLGAAIARDYGAPYHLDMRDLFIDSLRGLLPGAVTRAACLPLRLAERCTINRADTITVTSEAHRLQLSRAFARGGVYTVPNGIDELFLRFPFRQVCAEAPVRILYAGNLGRGQALDSLLPRLASRTQGRVLWQVAGQGGRRTALTRALACAGVRNVEVLPIQPRQALVRLYDQASALLLHLAPADAMERVVPSKLFEYAATGRPILAGAGGIAERFLRNEVRGSACFPPGNVDAALRALEQLPLRTHPRTAFRAKYNRETLTRNLADVVLTHLPPQR